MRPARTLLVLLGLALSTACGARPPVTGRTPPPPTVASKNASATPVRDVDLLAEARAVVDEVVTIRGLREKSPVAIDLVDDEGFVAAFTDGRADARWPDHEVLDDDDDDESEALYLGLYDVEKKQILLRRTLPAWARARGVDPRDVLAHFVVHALQDQHFDLSKPRETVPVEVDRPSAWHALVEGDAALVASAYAARRLHRPWKRVLVRAAADLPSAGVLADGPFSPLIAQYDDADALLFPYVDGARFVSTLYRAGGFALVDRAFARAPQTTQEVLQPERYLAGSGRASIGELPVPAGYGRGYDGVVGEFGMRELLQECLPRDDARRLAAKVRGARRHTFLPIAKKKGKAATVEITVWESDDDAAYLERTYRGCYASSFVRRRGAVVQIMENVPSPARYAPKLDPLVSAPPPASPPVGVVVVPPVPPRVAETARARGTFEGSTYASAWLGVRAQVPEGFGASVTEPGALLTISKQRTGKWRDTGAFTIVHGMAEERERAHRAFVRSFLDRMPEVPRFLRIREVDTPLGPGTDAIWWSGEHHLHDVSVPTCDGEASYLWVLAFFGDEGNDPLEAWRESFQRSGSGAACADLRGEEAEELP